MEGSRQKEQEIQRLGDGEQEEELLGWGLFEKHKKGQGSENPVGRGKWRKEEVGGAARPYMKGEAGQRKDVGLFLVAQGRCWGF